MVPLGIHVGQDLTITVATILLEPVEERVFVGVELFDKASSDKMSMVTRRLGERAVQELEESTCLQRVHGNCFASVSHLFASKLKLEFALAIRVFH